MPILRLISRLKMACADTTGALGTCHRNRGFHRKRLDISSLTSGRYNARQESNKSISEIISNALLHLSYSSLSFRCPDIGLRRDHSSRPAATGQQLCHYRHRGRAIHCGDQWWTFFIATIMATTGMCTRSMACPQRWLLPHPRVQSMRSW